MTRRAHAPTSGARTGSAACATTSERLCFALALWNERDPILKERTFGLTNSEGDHGEDVKEYYFYLDSTPTYVHEVPVPSIRSAKYPYPDLVRPTRDDPREELEYELLDTGIFDDDRYFDVFVEYSKEGPEDVLVRITVHNRGPKRPPGCAVADPIVSQHLVVGPRTIARRCASGAWHHSGHAP